MRKLIERLTGCKLVSQDRHQKLIAAQEELRDTKYKLVKMEGINAQLFGAVCRKLSVRVLNPVTTKTPFEATVTIQEVRPLITGWRAECIEIVAKKLAAIIVDELRQHDESVAGTLTPLPHVTPMTRQTEASKIKAKVDAASKFLKFASQPEDISANDRHEMARHSDELQKASEALHLIEKNPE